MTGLAHPLEDVLGALVEKNPVKATATRADPGWTWMLILVVAIGALAWFTR